MSYASGRHFLQIPGPTNVPDRVLRAMAAPTIDHRGPEFGALGREVLAELKPIFKTRNPVIIYPASGTGAWEAALVNTLSPGDEVLMSETGWFASLWQQMALKLGLKPEILPTDWRHGADPAAIENRLEQDRAHAIKAVCVVHNETSTGVVSRIGEVRRAIDRARPSGAVARRHDLVARARSTSAWTSGASTSRSPARRRGSCCRRACRSTRSRRARSPRAKSAKLPKAFWGWDEMLQHNKNGYFPYTPATNLLYGLREALKMLNEEGLENVFARHTRHGEATRRAVRAWGLDVLCANPADTAAR